MEKYYSNQTRKANVNYQRTWQYIRQVIHETFVYELIKPIATLTFMRIIFVGVFIRNDPIYNWLLNRKQIYFLFRNVVCLIKLISLFLFLLWNIDVIPSRNRNFLFCIRAQLVFSIHSYLSFAYCLSHITWVFFFFFSQRSLYSQRSFVSVHNINRHLTVSREVNQLGMPT